MSSISGRKHLQLSDGTLRFICLATLFLQPGILQPDAILVDEPELGSHPYALVILGDLWKKSNESAANVSTSTQWLTRIESLPSLA